MVCTEQSSRRVRLARRDPLMERVSTTVVASDSPAAVGTSNPSHPAGSELRRAALRHPRMVALLAVASAGLAFASDSPAAAATTSAFMAAALVVLAATDLEHGIVPSRLALPATTIIMVARIAEHPGRSLEFVIAAVAAAAAFLILNLISDSLMGIGDVKFVFLLGAGLGWGVIGAIAVAYLSVFPFALGTLVRGGLAARKATLPFGPFLALGGLVILIVPPLLGLGGN